MYIVQYLNPEASIWSALTPLSLYLSLSNSFILSSRTLQISLFFSRYLSSDTEGLCEDDIIHCSLFLSLSIFFSNLQEYYFWYRCIWQLFILFFMTLNPFLLMVNHALASIPPHSLFSLSLPSLSHIFLYFFIFGYFLINWRIDDIYSTHGCNTCMPAGLVA